MDQEASTSTLSPSTAIPTRDSAAALEQQIRSGRGSRWRVGFTRTHVLALAISALVASFVLSTRANRSFSNVSHLAIHEAASSSLREESESLAWKGRHLEAFWGGGRKHRRRRPSMPLESVRVTIMSNSTLLGQRFGDSAAALVLPGQPGSVGMWNAIMRPKPRVATPRLPVKPVIKKPKPCEPKCPKSLGIVTVSDDNPGKDCPKTFTRLAYRDISQAELLDFWLARADRGAPGVKEMLTSTPCDLWPFIQGRTVWVVGDSLAQETMKALMCFFTEFWDHDEYIDRPWADPARTAAQPLPTINNNGWCIYLPRETRICHIRSQNVPDLINQVLPGFKSGKFKKDLFLFNFAVHYNDPAKFKERLNQFADYYTQNSDDLPFFIWRDGSPQHFKTPHGVVTGARPRVPPGCQPLANVGLNDMNQLVLLNGDESELETLQGGWRNKLADPIMQELNIPNLHIWNESVMLNSFYYNYHPPGAKFVDCFYQLWVYKLLVKLREVKASLPPVSGRRR